MLPQPPATVRLGDGRYVPAQTSFNAKPNRVKKLLLVIQYYDGDKAEAEDLASLIADLERIRNRNTDVLIFGRSDAGEFDRTVISKLQAKFDKVLVQKCRRKGAKNYPFGPNEMFYDMVTLFSQFQPWNQDYYAFLNLEADCVPLHPGWLGELMEEFKIAKVHGFSAIGHLQPQHAVPHMNGVAVYDIDIWKIVGAGKLNGGNPRFAYDIDHARDLMPLAQDTPYIFLDFQRPTISPDDLFGAQKGNVEPAVYHGVKDGSARAAVRAKHVTFTATHETSRKTVFTYFNPVNAVGVSDNNAVVALWREAWQSRGWNPVVLGLREAMGNARYAEVMESVKRLPGLKSLHRIARWLALDTIGGGFLTDYDVVPGNFNPAHLEGLNPIVSFANASEASLSAVQFPRAQIGEWIDLLLNYDAQPGEKLVTDRTIFDATFSDPVGEDRVQKVVLYGEPGWREAQMIHFSSVALLKHGVRGQTKSRAIESYLRGE